MNRTTRLPRLALPFAIVLGLLVAGPALAASAVDLEARALLGGRYQVGGWAAVEVTLVNDGEPTEGHLVAEGDDGVVRRYVELPAGARKLVHLYVPPEAFQRQITIRYEEPNGAVEAVAEIRVLEQSSDVVAVVGDGSGTLRPQLVGDAAGSTEPLTLGVADLPERPEPLSGIDAIVWAADSSSLGEAQRRSLERWVADGGQLVVIGGADWQARTAAFGDLLPVEAIGAIDGVPQDALASWVGAAGPALATDTVSTGSLRPDARALVKAQDGAVIASMRSVGTGRVILLGSDLATDAYRAWEGSRLLWSRLLPSDAWIEQYIGGGMPPKEEMESSFSQALGNLPSLEVPPAELLLAVIVGYILLIGPISYVVLRRLDRRELAWVTAPLLVVLFSACSYGIGTSMKGSDIIVNEISLIRTSSAGGSASLEAYAGIFSPDRATYDVSVDADALITSVRSDPWAQPRQESDAIIEQGEPARVRDLDIGVFGFESLRADTVVDHQPALSVEWRVEDGELVGTVTNQGETALSDVAYVSQSIGEMIGDLEPGASAEVELSSLNFQGSSASDQVYGFGGFDTSSPDARRTILRRQVIDALVGYGGWMPGTDLAALGGRGPFLIGWTEAPGPVSFDIGERDAQRYSQTVEVLSVRPSVDQGEVTIGPGRMSVSIIATEGEVAQDGPAMVRLRGGSATFSIALPLEVADMTVTSVELIAGPDPGMLLDPNAGGFGGGFWPEGHVLEVRDPRSGAWTVLGDLSRQNRFEVDDPATIVGPGGRMEVRVSSGEIDPNWGETSVIVGAEVTGVAGGSGS
ncbi:MAG TPA: hypothetical protein VHQ42_00685 [Candidatus Limnocylindria bacterium]|nr:hypothetical protein [Candidatus Limnocylindria bacterium]